MSEPSRKTVKQLFGLCGNRCAFPKCTVPAVDPSGSITVQICHIRGEKRGAARWDESQSDEERQGFDNLLLMCGRHHKVIDDDPDSYTPERLLQIKRAHEANAERQPEPDDETVDRLI